MLIPLLLLITLLFSMSTSAQSPTAHILVYTAVAPGEYVHDSIPTAIEVLGQQTRAGSYGLNWTFSEAMGDFTDAGLEGFDAIMFVSTIGEVLDDSGKTALQAYLSKGGVFVGVHAAADGLRNASFFGKEVGARFDYHPDLQNATFLPLNTSHPATSMIPERWTYEEEVYFFKSDPRENGVDVLLSVDDSSYSNPGNRSTGNYNMGSPHPIAWVQSAGAGASPLAPSSPGAGRAFFTSLGHLQSTWRDEVFMGHLMGGLGWALDGKTTRAGNAQALVGNGGSGANATSSASAGSSMAGGSSTAAGSGGATSSSAAPSASSTSGAIGGNKAALGVGSIAALAAGIAVLA